MGLALGLSIVLIRALPLEELGSFYAISTLAYFGNALFLVGADFALQRRLRDLSTRHRLDRHALARYMGRALVPGMAASCLLALLVGQFGPPLSSMSSSLPLSLAAIAVLCPLVAAATFVVGLLRNLLQIAGEARRVGVSLVLEAGLRLLACGLALALIGPTALAMLVASVLASMALIVPLAVQVLRSTTPEVDPALARLAPGDLQQTLVPVGVGAVLNWLQLQGYRPLVGQVYDNAALVGVVSFLTALGGTVTLAVLGVAGQMAMPRQFSSGGASSWAFARLSAGLTLALAALAWPCATVFLHLIGRDELIGLEYLVCAGVLVDGGNFILGILGNHVSLTGKTFVPSLWAGMAGFVAMALMLLEAGEAGTLGPAALGLSLVVGQTLALVVMTGFALRYRVQTH
jgi:hypothetical protein